MRLPTPAAQGLRVLVDLHLILSTHVNSVCKSAFFSVSSIGRIGKYLDHDKCFLLYLKLKLSFMGSVPDKRRVSGQKPDSNVYLAQH